MLRDALTHSADSFYCGYYTWMMGNTIQSAANKHNVNGNKSEKFQGSWIGMVNYELLIKIQLIVKLKFVTMSEFLTLLLAILLYNIFHFFGLCLLTFSNF